MHFFFTPNHVQLLTSCYPPTSALLTAGPNYSPNSHELSRLTYYASNNPGKLARLASELEKRLKVECRKARAGNSRSRASLLITLSIFRSLATECRRDIALLSSAMINSVDITLSSLPSDLEIVARSASIFTAWTTLTDGHLIGADSYMTKNYISVLQKFANLSCSEEKDIEIRNRTRLIGFAALTGASNSEALYNDSVQFRAQVAIIMCPILMTLFQTDLPTLDNQASAVKDALLSPYLAEFRTRPAIERRAVSIHVHVDGDKGPSLHDVSNAALQTLFSLLSHANGVQLGYLIQSSFDNLDKVTGWSNLDHCCWFAQKSADWSQYQYRYVVPTWLVERLVKHQDDENPTHLHRALTTMVTTVFSSSTPLVNLSSSDILSNLVNLLVHRVAINPEDDLLPAAVKSIASLGHHVYYSDQVQDLAAELINRLMVIEVQGVIQHSLPGFMAARSSAIRCLLASLLGLVRAANRDGTAHNTGGYVSQSSGQVAQQQLLENSKRAADIEDRAFHRTRIPPDIWQETLSLLCDHDIDVRSEYSKALMFYLAQEMPKFEENTSSKDSKHKTHLEGLIPHGAQGNLSFHGGNGIRKFLNATNAYLYILATSSSLGLITPILSTSDTPISQGSTSSAEHNRGADLKSESDPLPQISINTSNSRRSFSAPQGCRIHKTSLIRRLMDRPLTLSGTGTPTSASPVDYSNIINILTTIQEKVPLHGLLVGVPMLVALDTVVESPEEKVTPERVYAIRDLIARIWLLIGKIWNSDELVDMVEKCLSSQPSFTNNGLLDSKSSYHEQPHLTWQGINVDEAIKIISCNEKVQAASSLNRDQLVHRLSSRWTTQVAMMDLDNSSTSDSNIRGDGLSPLLKISPALMHIENISLQSLTRSTRGLGVTDLREALEGRSSMSNTALARPPSISTLEHAPSVVGGDAALRLTRSRSRTRPKKQPVSTGSNDVRDVLTKLGIGKQNGNLLKSSFPALQKSDNVRVPPYKT